MHIEKLGDPKSSKLTVGIKIENETLLKQLGTYKNEKLDQWKEISDSNPETHVIIYIWFVQH